MSDATATGERPGRGRIVALTLVGIAVLAGVAVAAVALADRSGDPPAVAVRDVRAGERVGTTVAVYLDLANSGGADELVAVRSPDAARVLVHGTDDVGIMRTSPSLEIPPTSTLVLEPGGTHLMLEGVGRQVEPGDTIALEFEFDRGAPLQVQATVVPLETLAEGPS